MTKNFKHLPYVLMLLIIIFALFAHRYFGSDPIGEASRPPNSAHAHQEKWSDQCRSGSPQSPIALETDQLKSLATSTLQMHLKPTRVSIVDTGYTFSIEYNALSEGGTLKFENDTFRIRRISFHKPSEHLLDGRQFDMEANLVFENEDSMSPNRAISLNLLVEEGKHNSELQSAWNHLPPMREGYGEKSGKSVDKFESETASNAFKKKRKVLGENINFDASKLLRDHLQFVAYVGSSTDPECQQGYVHLTSLTPIEFDHNQVEHFEGYYEGNNRDVQQIGENRLRNFRLGVLQ